jgi:tetratricopeptide (TPR) repeat protein
VNKPVLVSILVAVVCAFAFRESAHAGFARTYAMRALSTNGIESGERAAQLAPADAEVHGARGVVLQRTENYGDACRELERAIQLRPRDYFLWMMLGVTRDLNDNQPGGLAALRESIRLAPFYAKPRWLTGNLLLRMGQVDDAFQQMRFAAERDAVLLPNVIDLAWGASRNDAAQTLALMQPQTDGARMALASFLAAHKEGAASLDQFRHAKSPAVAASDQLTQRLIESRFFSEAYEVWAKTHCPLCKPGAFVNGSFEEAVELNNQGFGWQIPANIKGVTPSVDEAEHENGSKSLRLDFNSPTETQAVLLSQLLVVKPGARYRISVHARTKAFLSITNPVIKVVDLSGDKSTTLAQSVIKSDTSEWQPYALYFSSGPNTGVVRLILTREECLNNPCPAFGTLWLDSFFLEEAYEKTEGSKQ